MRPSFRILHVVNKFDPAGDVIRCFHELKKHSRHQHELVIREPHPGQEKYAYPEAALMEWNTLPPATAPVPPEGLSLRERRAWRREHSHRRVSPMPPLVAHLMDWADGIIWHFTGPGDGWTAPDSKPQAFRNINIYWNAATDTFWSSTDYNCEALDQFKLISSSHVGARDFMPGENFRWLPDLLPIFDPLYTPSDAVREPCVSYIKHSPVLKDVDFGAAHLNLDGVPHPQVLFRRKTQATVVIDNVCDGHFGLAGLEAMSLGLPLVVFNHEKTREGLKELAPTYPPFTEVGPSVQAAIDAARRLLAISETEMADLRFAMRDWMEAHWNSRRLIEKCWDKFADELAG